MAKKGRKPSAKEVEAGRQNLLAYREKNPFPSLKHGAYSGVVRAKYRDGRYKESRELKGILQRLTADAGGPENLSEGQRIMLGVIRSKFIVAKQISDFVTKQEGIVDSRGEILPCLKSFCTFTEAMRRCVEAFYSLGSRKASKAPDIEKYIEETYGK